MSLAPSPQLLDFYYLSLLLLVFVLLEMRLHPHDTTIRNYPHHGPTMPGVTPDPKFDYFLETSILLRRL